MNNKMKVEFPSKSINEALARVIISGFVMPLDPTIEEISDIKTAVSEAVTNCVIHGYDGKDGVILMEAEIDDRTLIIKISDSGVGIADINKAREPLYTTKPECDRSGMGFTVMESFMDSLHIESAPNEGTSVTMIKRL